jgi:two-component system, chemotaxis family, sensor kinase CheA
MSDFRQELLAAFDAEYRDHLAVIRAALGRARRGGPADVQDIFRRVHSLKGAARAVDLPAVAELAHELEALIARLIDLGGALERSDIAAIESGLDEIETVITGAEAPVAAPAEGEEPATGLLRVEAAQVADLIAAATQLAQAVERHDGLGARLLRIEQSARHARRLLEPLLRHAQTPPALVEAAADLQDVARESAVARHHFRDVSWALEEASRRVRGDVDRISLVPADVIFGPMARMLRDLAAEEGVEIEADFQGLDLQADRRVLQALKDAVLQLLRNAVGHGAAPAEQRRARALPDATRITLSLAAVGGLLVTTVTDDGSGPDLEAIRARALARGLLTPRTAPQVTPEQLMALVFEPGFSTRPDVGQLAGRGMGLSIVAEAARRLHGTAGMMRVPGGGTAVKISVPLSVARHAAVLLGFGDRMAALPAAAVLRLIRVPQDRIEPIGGRMSVRIDGPTSARTAAVAVLGDLLGLGGAALPVEDGHVKLAVMRASHGGEPMALAVDRFQDVRSFLVHSAEIVGLDTELVSGFVLLENEVPAPLLAPDGLIAAWHRRGGWSGEQAPAPEVAPAPADHTILVVDDSITSRTLEKSILEAHGYRVAVAVDGMEALNVLRATRGRNGARMIDMVLADVEMPRMDGFALLAAMKGDPLLAGIPVIIMTSRESPADVRRGLDLGASAYIAKQTFDQRDLLGAIGRLL